MTGGAGFIIDMNNKIKENQALRKKRKNFFEKETVVRSLKLRTTVDDIQTASPEELDAFHEKLKQSRKKDRIKAYLIFASSILITVLLIFGLIYMFNYILNN